MKKSKSFSFLEGKTKKQIEAAADKMIKDWPKHMEEHSADCVSCGTSFYKIGKEERCRHCQRVRDRSISEGRMVFI